MRPGLVAVGAAFAVVGAAVIIGMIYPSDASTGSRTSVAEVDGLAGGSWRPFALSATPSSSVTVTLSWYASTGNPRTTARVNVSFYAARACPPATEPCPVGPALKAWNVSTQGRWSASGASGSLYMLYVVVPDAANVSDNFTATFAEQYRTSSLPLPMVPFAITMAGGALLAGVGAVGVYLGLFLPSGVYDPPDIGGADGPDPTAPDDRPPPREEPGRDD